MESCVQYSENNEQLWQRAWKSQDMLVQKCSVALYSTDYWQENALGKEPFDRYDTDVC